MPKPPSRKDLLPSCGNAVGRRHPTVSSFRVLPQLLRNASPKVMPFLGQPTFSDLVKWQYKVPVISVQKVKCSQAILAQELPTGLAKSFK